MKNLRRTAENLPRKAPEFLIGAQGKMLKDLGVDDGHRPIFGFGQVTRLWSISANFRSPALWNPVPTGGLKFPGFWLAATTRRRMPSTTASMPDAGDAGIYFLRQQ